MKYYLIAGEASGDLHGANLIKALKEKDPAAQFRCWGGDLMSAAGAEVVKHYRDLAFMGFWEVAKNLGTILKNLSWCKKDIDAFHPDVIILIDYPGFNLRLAKFGHRAGYKVFYYISPQVWAWKSSRVKLIKQVVDRMFVILPFEKDFYQKWQYEVDFVGHPLLDAVSQSNPDPDFKRLHHLPDKPLVALLAGSRQQEIKKMLPVMLAIAPDFDDVHFVIGGAAAVPQAFYRQFDLPANVSLVHNQTHQLMQHASAALVTSGTATLETALFKVPQAVCYKGGKVSFFIGKLLVHVKYISLVNLIMDKKVVQEFIQKDFHVDNLKEALNELLYNKKYLQAIFEDYETLRLRLGGAGASEKTARLMLSYLK